MPPSPTGHLHIGTARTALFNYLFAAHCDGEMILRSEDTDKERSKKEYETEIIEGLKWLGIKWSNEKIFRQSERTDVYRQYLEKAIADGTAYVSKEESKREPGTMVEVIRIKNPNKKITFTDLIRGDITFDTTELGDFVIARSIEDALYHLTVVVDDHEMGITHVLRGEDHISNTPRQILIQEAIGAKRPVYAHLPLILAPDRSKMSKRHGAVSLNEYIEEGFTKEAIVNYLALLGWNPGTNQEIFTIEELIKQFSIEHIQKGGAIFDKQKFRWVNKQHLEKLTDEDYLDMVKKFLTDDIKALPNFSEATLKKLLPTMRERIEVAGDITEAAKAGEYNWVFEEPDIKPEMLKWKKDPTIGVALPRLQTVRSLLEKADFSSPNSIKEALWSYAEAEGKGEVLWPLRVALTGLEKSPDPFSCAFIIGQQSTLERIDRACDKIVG